VIGLWKNIWNKRVTSRKECDIIDGDYGQLKSKTWILPTGGLARWHDGGRVQEGCQWASKPTQDPTTNGAGYITLMPRLGARPHQNQTPLGQMPWVSDWVWNAGLAAYEFLHSKVGTRTRSTGCSRCTSRTPRPWKDRTIHGDHTEDYQLREPRGHTKGFTTLPLRGP